MAGSPKPSILAPTPQHRWSSRWNAVLIELQPFEGRLAMAWRTAAVCALTAMVFMTYEVPLVSIGCYLIMFLAKPNAQENVVVACGITLLVSLVVVLLLFLTHLAIEVPLWRMLIIVLGSYFFLFIGAASMLGPGGNIVALVIGFIMTLLPYVPFGEVATRGILYAWLMVLIPMGVVVVFHTMAGRSAGAELQSQLARRLRLTARAIETLSTDTSCLDELDYTKVATSYEEVMLVLREGQSKLESLLKLVRLFHLLPTAQTNALGCAIQNSHAMLIHLGRAQLMMLDQEPAQSQDIHGPWFDSTQAVGIPCELASLLAERCHVLAKHLADNQSAQAIKLGSTQPITVTEPSLETSPTWSQGLVDDLNGYFCAKPDAGDNSFAGVTGVRANDDKQSEKGLNKKGFFKPDAWRNPEYSRFAIKTTAAAVVAYIIYTSIQWQGIHTAMITCYVAALTSSGETVHKLTLRIIGCLIGATMGMASLAFLIPHMTSIGQLMVLVFAGVLMAAWVSSGSERIAYAGIQIGLAFLMTVLQDFQPDVSMSVAMDRIYGILLGNALLFLMFTQLWPVPVKASVERSLQACQTSLDDLTNLIAAGYKPTEQARWQRVEDCLTELGKARETLIYNLFEPRSLAASTDELVDIRQRISAMERYTLILSGLPPEKLDEAMQQYQLNDTQHATRAPI